VLSACVLPCVKSMMLYAAGMFHDVCPVPPNRRPAARRCASRNAYAARWYMKNGRNGALSEGVEGVLSSLPAWRGREGGITRVKINVMVRVLESGTVAAHRTSAPAPPPTAGSRNALPGCALEVRGSARRNANAQARCRQCKTTQTCRECPTALNTRAAWRPRRGWRTDREGPAALGTSAAVRRCRRAYCASRPSESRNMICSGGGENVAP